MIDTPSTLLALIGCYALLCYLYDNLKAPTQFLLSLLKRLIRLQNEADLQKRFGNWAAITGATDGIGKAYAREFARRGLNVVLISRTEKKLQAVAATIESEFAVQTKIIEADFTSGKDIYDHINKQLSDLPVGILVNNVGQNTTEAGAICTFSADELINMIQTNIVAVTLMSRLFIRRMHAAKLKGVIVNIGSVTALQPLPYVALYSASKAYTRSLTLAMQKEAEYYGVKFQLVSPNFVHTKLLSSAQTTKLNCFFTKPERYASWAIDTIGTIDETTGYFWHALQTAIIKTCTERIRHHLATLIVKLFYDNKFRPLDTTTI